MARTYNQECPLALALDLLGERWTLLIVRELLFGPRRFADLQEALAGMGANLLSKRLKSLEDAEIIETENQARSRYRLSPAGERLRPIIRDVMLWSVEYHLERPHIEAGYSCIHADNLTPNAVAFAIEIFGSKCAEPGPDYVIHIYIDELPYTFYFMNNDLIARRGADAPAIARIDADVATLMRALRHEISIDQLRNAITTTGDDRVIDHLTSALINPDFAKPEGLIQIAAKAQ